MNKPMTTKEKMSHSRHIFGNDTVLLFNEYYETLTIITTPTTKAGNDTTPITLPRSCPLPDNQIFDTIGQMLTKS